MGLDRPEATPLVSVIIPCYNAEKFVEEAVRSVVNQTYKNLEIIVVDDCSTDGTGEILQRLAHEDDRVRYFRNKENKKLIWSLNFGLEQCQGSLIARMDADDVCHPDRIRKQVRYILERSVDIVSCFSLYLNEDGSLHSLNTYFCTTRSKSVRFVSLIENPILHPGAMGKREVLLDARYVNNPKTLHAEDYDLWSRLLRKGKIVEVIGEYLLFYRRNSQSVTHLFRDVQNRNQQLISVENIAYFLQMEIRSDLHTLILSKQKAKVSRVDISEALVLLETLRNEFVRRYSCDRADCLEIDQWIAARFLRMIAYYIMAESSIVSPANSLWLLWKFRKICLSKSMCAALYTIVRSRTGVRKYSI